MGTFLRGAYALAAFVVLAAPVDAQEVGVGFAVLRFEDGGSYGQGKDVFRSLELAIPELLAATLSRHPNVRVVERGRLTQVMREQSLSTAPRMDAATASRIAKGAAARYAVTGSFADFYGKLRINARVVDAETGQILKVVSSDPRMQDRAQLSTIIESVSEAIVAAVGLPPYPATAAHPAVPAEAYQQALSAFPGFHQAREGPQRVR